jgi:hypothetical protein
MSFQSDCGTRRKQAYSILPPRIAIGQPFSLVPNSPRHWLLERVWMLIVEIAKTQKRVGCNSYPDTRFVAKGYDLSRTGG